MNELVGFHLIYSFVSEMESIGHKLPILVINTHLFLVPSYPSQRKSLNITSSAACAFITITVLCISIRLCEAHYNVGPY